MVSEITTLKVIPTGVAEIDGKLDGGIPAGTLGLIEGQPDAGKSVLCQHLIHGALNANDSAVAYYTTENSVRGLLAQMDSLSLHTLDYFLTDRLRIYPLVLRSDVKNADNSLQILTEHLSNLPEHFKLIIVDTITLFVAHSSPAAILNFFLACKELSEQGRTVLLVVHSHAFKQSMLTRAISICDAYLKLRLEEVGSRLIRVMEVIKLRGARPFTERVISFEVKPGAGIKELPFAKAKATAV